MRVLTAAMLLGLTAVAAEPPREIAITRVFPNAVTSASLSPPRTGAASDRSFPPPAYTGGPQPYGELFVMRYDGTGVEQLTDNQWEDDTLAWRPSHIHERKD